MLVREAAGLRGPGSVAEAGVLLCVFLAVCVCVCGGRGAFYPFPGVFVRRIRRIALPAFEMVVHNSCRLQGGGQSSFHDVDPPS